jgi:hypothetical protein
MCRGVWVLLSHPSCSIAWLRRSLQVLAAVEAESARTYWQLPAAGSAAYPLGSFVAAAGPNPGDSRSYNGYGANGKRVAGKIYQVSCERVHP